MGVSLFIHVRKNIHMFPENYYFNNNLSHDIYFLDLAIPMPSSGNFTIRPSEPENFELDTNLFFYYLTCRSLPNPSLEVSRVQLNSILDVTIRSSAVPSEHLQRGIAQGKNIRRCQWIRGKLFIYNSVIVYFLHCLLS